MEESSIPVSLKTNQLYEPEFKKRKRKMIKTTNIKTHMLIWKDN
jgi:hypothetical protein